MANAEKRGLDAGQVRIDVFLARAIVSDGGIAASARRRMFGRGRSAKGVRLTFRQCYKASTCRLCHRRLDAAGQRHRPQLMERIRCWCTKPNAQRKRGDRWQAKYGLKTFLRKLSPLMVTRNGIVVSAQRRT